MDGEPAAAGGLDDGAADERPKAPADENALLLTRISDKPQY